MRQELLNHLRQLEEPQVYRSVFTDPLTGALNRRAFDRDRRLFVAIVDVDSLKYVNDTYSHRRGDELLRQLATLLAGCFGPDNVYRLHGDEFAVRGEHALELHHRLLVLRESFPCFSFGISAGLERADDKLKEDKQRRERAGVRAPRGVCPPWVEIL